MRFKMVYWAPILLLVNLADANLEWNSLSDYLKTFEDELKDEFTAKRTTTTTVRPPMFGNPMLKSGASFEGPAGRFEVSKLLQRLRMMNITDPAIPPLLQMYPGSRDKTASLSNSEGQDVGEPLFITPMIESNLSSETIKAKARVQDEVLDSIATSYTGYLTVNKEYNSNLFFWYIPAKHPRRNGKPTPLLLWLQGGPGGSSLFGLFIEHGPFLVQADLKPVTRNISWTDSYNVLYIDQPVGTGFSFTEKDEGYVTNQVQVANDLYEALRQFFIVFKEVQSSDFYISGESYAGKYVPAISYKIHKMNQDPQTSTINLKGLAIGDGLTDPIHQMSYGDFLFQTGLVDELDRNTLTDMSKVCKQYIKQGRWGEAAGMFNKMINYFTTRTGLNFVYNYLLQGQPAPFSYYPKYLRLPKTRRGIHVGNKDYNDVSEKVYAYLQKDIPKTVRPWLETLLDANYKVLIYSGQVDVIVAYPQTEEFLANLEWSGAQAYKSTERKIWKVGDDIAGYTREVKNFKQIMVRNSGHILPFDQPVWAFDMISRFVEDKPFQ